MKRISSRILLVATALLAPLAARADLVVPEQFKRDPYEEFLADSWNSTILLTSTIGFTLLFLWFCRFAHRRKIRVTTFTLLMLFLLMLFGSFIFGCVLVFGGKIPDNRVSRFLYDRHRDRECIEYFDEWEPPELPMYMWGRGAPEIRAGAPKKVWDAQERFKRKMSAAKAAAPDGFGYGDDDPEVVKRVKAAARATVLRDSEIE